MPKRTYFEAIGILGLAIVCFVLGKYFDIPALESNVGSGLVGVAMGYLGGNARAAGP